MSLQIYIFQTKLPSVIQGAMPNQKLLQSNMMNSKLVTIETNYCLNLATNDKSHDSKLKMHKVLRKLQAMPQL